MENPSPAFSKSASGDPRWIVRASLSLCLLLISAAGLAAGHLCATPLLFPPWPPLALPLQLSPYNGPRRPRRQPGERSLCSELLARCTRAAQRAEFSGFLHRLYLELHSAGVLLPTPPLTSTEIHVAMQTGKQDLWGQMSEVLYMLLSLFFLFSWLRCMDETIFGGACWRGRSAMRFLRTECA